MTDRHVDIRWRLLDEPPPDELPQLLLSELKSTQEFFNKDSENQFRRRTLYRNSFAYVEGILHFLKMNTFSHYVRVVLPVVMFWKEHFDLDFPESGFFRLIDEDVLLSLLDKRTHIDETGKWHLRDDRLPTSTNIRFTFRIITHIYGIDNLARPFDGGGWRAFQRCVTTRNRVTHPKVLEEFQVTDSEISDLNQAINWFQLTATSLLTESIKAIEWDQPRVEKFVATVPLDARSELIARLMEIFNFSWDDLKSAEK